MKIPEGTVTSPLGFKAAAVACGLKKSGKLDLALLYSEHPCTAAGVFTRNQVAAAPVILDKATLAANRQTIRGVVANAGIANACTGEQGLIDAREMQRAAAKATDGRPDQFLVLSTGVIGATLPLDKIKSGIRLAVESLSNGEGAAAARAIMTTDTVPKQLAVQFSTPGGVVTIGGMAKGSGMIHPDMATMLAVITTDAALPADLLQTTLTDAVDQSFNCISVDGDTSTNDTVLLLANGAGGAQIAGGNSLIDFSAALNYVCTELAHMIVRDGEGVSKFVELRVSGAASIRDARRIASTIATSPLVKTALAGSDANWGRILAAAGRAGVTFDQGCLSLWVSNPRGKPLKLVEKGTPTGYSESEASTIFAQDDIVIGLDLGQGNEEAIMWTGDLTHDYVTINADYRT